MEEEDASAVSSDTSKAPSKPDEAATKPDDVTGKTPERSAYQKSYDDRNRDIRYIPKDQLKPAIASRLAPPPAAGGSKRNQSQQRGGGRIRGYALTRPPAPPRPLTHFPSRVMSTKSNECWS